MKKIDVIQSKVVSIDVLKKLLAVWQFKGQKIVFTNGCFDILHLGHIDYLAKAADCGDVLIIGLNSDSSTKKIKGPKRPINDEHSRAMLLASLRFVDAVVLFNEETPLKLIELIKPNVLVKGSDYKKEEVVGYETVTSNGGEVITMDLLPNYSTTAIEERIRNK